jgi:hypothetical protein
MPWCSVGDNADCGASYSPGKGPNKKKQAQGSPCRLVREYAEMDLPCVEPEARRRSSHLLQEDVDRPLRAGAEPDPGLVFPGPHAQLDHASQLGQEPEKLPEIGMLLLLCHDLILTSAGPRLGNILASPEKREGSYGASRRTKTIWLAATLPVCRAMTAIWFAPGSSGRSAAKSRREAPLAAGL